MITTNVKLTLQQIDFIRGILYNYYSQNEYWDEQELHIHNDVEIILKNAENSFLEKG